jgi:hypothetical protein
VRSPSSPPPFSPRTWPIALNVFLLMVLVATYQGDSYYLLLFVPLTLAINLMGAVVALFRRKWAVAAWYGVGLLVTVGIIIVVAAIFGDNSNPLYKDE